MRTHFFVLAVLMSPMTLVAQTASTKPLPGKWTIERDKSEMDDSRIVTLSLSAERAITVWLKEVVPKLILRCKEGKMDAYIFTRTAAQPELGQYEQASVRWRIDDSTATPEMWNESTDKSALFSPAPVEFVRRLTEAKTFRFEFTHAMDATKRSLRGSRWSASFGSSMTADSTRSESTTIHRSHSGGSKWRVGRRTSRPYAPPATSRPSSS
jgi:hypothetical protein